MTRALLPFDKRKVSKPSPRKAQSKNFSSIAKPSFSDACAAAKKLRAGRRPVKKRNTKRAAANNARAYGPQDFREFLHAHPCLGCGGLQNIQQAHLHTGGGSRKDDSERTGPLCGPHCVITPGIGARVVEGCHYDYDHAKKSWGASHDIERKQRAFFAKYKNVFGERAE